MGDGVTEEKHTWDIILILVFFSWLKFDLWKWDVTGNLQVDIVIGMTLDTLYISVYNLLSLTLMQYTWLCLCLLSVLHFVNTIFFLNKYAVVTELISVSIENSRYNDIYLCLLDIICVFAVISCWTLSLIQIYNIGY